MAEARQCATAGPARPLLLCAMSLQDEKIGVVQVQITVQGRYEVYKNLLYCIFSCSIQNNRYAIAPTRGSFAMAPVSEHIANTLRALY